MEEKNKSGQITFGTYAVIVTIVFLVLLVGILAGMLIQKNNEEKVINATENVVSNTKNQVTENVIENSSENKIDTSIQKGNDEKENINDITNNSNEQISKDDQKDIEDTIKKYYKLLGKKEQPASMLEDMGFTVQAVQDPDYAPSGYVEYPNGEYMWTGIKYIDLTGEIWYITEDIIKSQFKEFVEYKGYLYIKESFNKSDEYTIQSMELKESSKNKCTYLVKVKKSNYSKTYTQEITLGRGNGDFVIMEINDK